uniref:Protein GPR107 n=1 Tax=Ditylenchus dipsaci TaxID=166011 RepID=A0A915DVL2_9BILA
MLFYKIVLLFVIGCLCFIEAKIHFLSLTDDSRRNILLSKFGFDANGTFDFILSNFTVPDAVVTFEDNKENKFGYIGFTLSRSNVIAEDIRSNPHVCQLQQHDQGIDALFFVFNFPEKVLVVTRSGDIEDIQLCASADECPISSVDNVTPQTTTSKTGILSNIFGSSSNKNKIAYQNIVPLTFENNQYSTRFGIHFTEKQRGLYNFLYHNCFNYRAHGYSDKVAVDFKVSIVERNTNSYLSAGDIPKPRLYLYMSFLFSLATVLWINVLCKSDAKNVLRVHKLMTALVVLKAISLFFHGMNFYFVSAYGHQREIWAVVYYITHLLKGALLFGTIILIGTGYTFFKNFLADRDRNLFMMVIPLQVIDNIAMVILEESEFGESRYYFWFEIFVFLDLVCCMAILFPIIWSMRHLQEGARTDGKAAFNLERLQLFRHFYLIIISYIYLTRITKFIVEYLLPFNYQWISEAIVELSTLFSSSWLVQEEEDGDVESAQALTPNGLYENVSRVQRISVQDELDDIPGTIAGGHSDQEQDDDNDDDDQVISSLLPKTGRQISCPLNVPVHCLEDDKVMCVNMCHQYINNYDLRAPPFFHKRCATFPMRCDRRDLQAMIVTSPSVAVYRNQCGPKIFDSGVSCFG